MNDIKDKIINRFEELAKEESKASSLAARQAADKVKEFDEKTERLIDLYIAKEISQEEYQRKKAKLLNEKKDLQERLGEIEKSGGGWLGPAKEFVSTCNAAGSVAWQGNPSAKRDFLKILGLNLVLKDRNLLFSTKKPYSLVSGIGLKENWLPLEDSDLGPGGYKFPEITFGLGLSHLPYFGEAGV